ncbi:MAG TPA: hypothetical protein VIE65_04115 [Methylobacter sp.]|jgi:hypothetical protein
MKQLIRERLAKIKKVYAHGSCPDGSAAAMIIAAAFKGIGVKPEFEFIQHRTQKHREIKPEENILFVDITPDAESWESWKGFNPIVLDHHETAAYITTGLGGIFGGPEESGATLAWAHVMCPLCPEICSHWGDFARISSIRDNWMRENKLFPQSCGQAAALTLFGGVTLVEAVQAGTLDLNQLQSWGEKMYGQQQHKAKRIAENAHIFEDFFESGLIRIAFFNCTEKLASDVCDMLLEEHKCEVACGYFIMHEDGVEKIVFSIRTHRSGSISGEAVAKYFGGGGHKNSASFNFPEASEKTLNSFFSNIRQVVKSHGIIA